MARTEDAGVLRLSFDLRRPGARLQLVKDIVAVANSGGGTLRLVLSFQPGSGPDAAQQLAADAAAAIRDLDRYIQPQQLRFEQEVFPLDGECTTVNLRVAPTGKYPLVMTCDGQYLDDTAGVIVVFRAGDIFVCHEGIGRRAVLADIVALIDRATGSATALIDLIASRRRKDTAAMLTGPELLSCLVEVAAADLTPGRLDVLIRSALRRPPTLYFWLSHLTDRSLIESILLSSLDDEDRDKSDAKDSILEVAALIADERCLAEILDKMRASPYSHFREAAAAWTGRRDAFGAFEDRAYAARVDDQPAVDLPARYLEKYGVQLAEEMCESREAARHNARALADVGRALFLTKWTS